MRISGIPMGIRKGMVLGMIAAAMLSSAVYAGDAPAGDPATMAANFEKQAAELRASAEKHDHMAMMHKSGGGSSKANHAGIVSHCEMISKNLRAAAAESEAAAAELRSGAKK